MKNTPPVRGVGRLFGALITAVAIALTGTAAAHAAPANPPTESDVVLTKLEQPEQLGLPATGVEQTVTGAAPVAGAEYELYLVPGTEAGVARDIGTNTGQQFAAGLAAPAEAEGVDYGDAVKTGTTGSNGVISWSEVPRGLYVVRETVTPVGATQAPDFFLAVPLTDPVNLNDWLDTIYVYPKNSVVSGVKTVTDAVFDESGTRHSSYATGENVTWNITGEVPRINEPGVNEFVAPTGYQISDTVSDSQLRVVGTPTVTLGGTVLVESSEGSDGDYLYTTVKADGFTTHQVTFTATGLEALAAAVNQGNGNAVVNVELITEVLAAGEITNSAQLYPNQAAIEQDTPVILTPAEIRFGGYQINKVSSDAANTGLAGAEFRVYLNEDDALAGGDNYVVTASNEDGLWVTNAEGRVVVDGLRYSQWVDGAPTEETQTYWLVETTAPEGHQLLAEPVSFVVDAHSATQVDEQIVNAPTTGGWTLPLTGGSGTMLLTAGGLVLLGIALALGARRRASAQSAQSVA